MYLERADNCPVENTSGIPPFHHYGRGTTWDTTSCSTRCCSSHCYGSVCSCIGHGDGLNSRWTGVHPPPPRPSRSALVTQNPSLVSSISHTVTRVCMSPSPARKPLPPRHPYFCAGEDADARSIPGISSVPMRIV